MDSKNKKTLLLNTLLLFFCVVVVVVFCLLPSKQVEKVLETYKITFNTDGGNQIAAMDVEDGKTFTKPADPVKEGYVFIGWMYKGELYDFSNPVEGDIVLEASWQEVKPDIKYYTLSFDSAGGTTIANQTLEEGAVPTRPSDPVREGYTFNGWLLNGANYDFSQGLTADITIIATWTENETPPEEPPSEEPEVKTFRVRFNLNGGSGSIKTQTIEEGKTAKKPTNPKRNGYTFNGWLLNGKDYNFNSPVTKDITLTAKWTQNVVVLKNFDVNFYNENGTLCKSLTAKENSTVVIPDNCKNQTRAGHNFKGWSTSKGASSSNFSNSTKITKTMNLYPAFAKKNYQVSCTKGGNMGSPTCELKASIDGKEYKGKINIKFGSTPAKDYPTGKVPLGNVKENITATIDDNGYKATVVFKVS